MNSTESIETRQRIARECRQMVLSQGSAGAMATLGVASLFWLSVRDVHTFEQLVGWASAVAVVCALRVVLAARSKRSVLDVGSDWPNTPLTCIVVGALSGGVWGAAATLLFPVGHSELYFVTAFLLIGMPAGAISSFGAWWPAYAAYVLASVGPFALYFLTGGQDEFIMAGLAACLFGVFLLREGFVISRTIQRNIAQRIALLAMTESLGDALDRADAANRAKSTFLANMSHELRTPLNAIIGMSQLLAESPDLPQHRRLPDTIHRAGQSLLALISDVLDLSQIEAGKITLQAAAFGPRRLVEEVIDMFSPEAVSKSLRIDVAFASSVPERFVGDQARLRQVLVNVVSNAIKFTTEGGVRIDTDLEIDPVSGRVLVIDVTDTGPGIPASDQQRIFSAFQQGDNSVSRAHQGTGLGLNISRDLIALMGGRIELRSAPGAGSRFRVRVPESPVGPDASASQLETSIQQIRIVEAALAPLAGLRILVVEDNALNASLVKLMLERDGCIVECVNSGAQALECMWTGSWRVVLMDCQMPGMDGYAATCRWREIEAAEGLARLPILALTAHAMADDRQRCLDAGMDDYLTKPVKLESLRAALSRLVAMGEAGNGTLTP
jgi:signal transduction histidine kinase/ActR/RegA family two-component response regulator